MTMWQVAKIIDTYRLDEQARGRQVDDPWQILEEACQEVARQAGIHYTSDDILTELLLDKLPAFGEWWDFIAGRIVE